MSTIPPEGSPDPNDEQRRRAEYLESLEEGRIDNSGGWSALRSAAEIDEGEQNSGTHQRSPGPNHGARSPSRVDSFRPERVPWERPSDTDRQIGALGARQALAILKGETQPHEDDIAEMRQMIQDELQVRTVPNREFDVPFLDLSGRPNVATKVQSLESWLVNHFAQEDRFGPTTEGSVERSACLRDFLSVGNSAVVEQAWQQVVGGNKLDPEALYQLALDVEEVKGALLSDTSQASVRIKREAITRRLKSSIPTPSKFGNMNYKQQERAVRRVEEMLVDFLWTLQDSEYAKGIDLQQKDFDDFDSATEVAHLASIRYGEDRIVKRSGNHYIVVAA